jgi:protein transport protein SEC31
MKKSSKHLDMMLKEFLERLKSILAENNRKKNKLLLVRLLDNLEEQKNSFSMLSAEEASKFFEQLGETGRKDSDTTSIQRDLDTDAPGSGRPSLQGASALTETISRNTNWDEGPEAMIKKNLLIGNLEGAMDCAMKCGRYAEAILISLKGGDELFLKAKEIFFGINKDNFVKNTVKSIVNDEIDELVTNSTFKNWKEALAYCLSYSKAKKREELANALAEDLLEKKKDPNSALICFMIARNISRVIDLWRRRLGFIAKRSKGATNELLFAFFQKVVVLKTTLGDHEKYDDMDVVFSEFAEVISNNGLKELAMKYLEFTDTDHPKVGIIIDRIFNSDSKTLSKMFQRPPFPYTHEEVKI